MSGQLLVSIVLPCHGAARKLASMDEMQDSTGRSSLRLALPFLFLAGLVFVGDQVTKLVVVASIDLYQSVPAEGILRLTHVTNTGSAFGLLRGQSAFLILASFIGIFGVVFYFRANGRHSALLRVALALILGGAFGNLTDRLVRGAVVDFIDVRLWPGFHFPTFNLADSALTVGLALLAFYILRERDREKKRAMAPGASAIASDADNT